jgi:hypothetical protein
MKVFKENGWPKNKVEEYLKKHNYITDPWKEALNNNYSK